MSLVKDFAHRAENIVRTASLGKTMASIGFTASLLGGLATYEVQKSHEGMIELAFSEIGEISHQFIWYGKEIPPLTYGYAIFNDVPMKTFEANNLAYEWNMNFSSLNDRFGYEIEKKYDPALRIDHQISEYAPKFPALSKRMLTSVDKYVRAHRDIAPIVTALRDDWDVSHVDHTKKVAKRVDDCAGTEKPPCPRTVWVDVYDYTLHSFTYNKPEGLQAAKSLAQFVARYPELKIAEQLVVPKFTKAENEWAMRRSRRNQSDFKPTQNDYDKLAATWVTSSNLEVFKPRINEALGALQKGALPLQQVAQTARSETFITRIEGQGHPGPAAYQFMEAVEVQAKKLEHGTGKVVDGISFAGEKIPVLARNIAEFIQVTQHGRQGDATALRRSIMSDARAIYNANFTDGMDNRPAKYEWVFFIGLLAGAVGAGTGYGLRRVLDGPNMNR